MKRRKLLVWRPLMSQENLTAPQGGVILRPVELTLLAYTPPALLPTLLTPLEPPTLRPSLRPSLRLSLRPSLPQSSHKKTWIAIQLVNGRMLIRGAGRPHAKH